MNYPTNKFLVYLFVVAISTLNAAGQTISNPTLPSNQLLGANWIGDAKLQPTIDSLMYEDDPAPLFRKSFTVPANSEAFIKLPFKDFSKISITLVKNNKPITTNSSKLNFNLKQGNYQITVNTLNDNSF